jgi:DNA (cytosine-5)-methyltransferase 1
MKHGSLFSGIGGFDLAAEWMGWDNEFHCEWAEFPRKILHHYWPEAVSYADITKTDFNVHRNQIDILTGGFPCQPYSTAGKRKGKDDDRHLWPHMLRAIREIRPRWVVGENVFGLTTWNGGVVLEEVCAELEAEGYAVQPFVIPACAIGAPHRRDRVWFVAHCETIRWHGRGCEHRENINKNNARIYEHRQERHKMGGKLERHSKSRITTDTQMPRSAWQCEHRPWQGKSDRCHSFDLQADWENFPTVTPICGGDDGIPRELDGITIPKWRNESIKGYGNAIVPQVAFQIFKAIEHYEHTNSD